VSTAKHNNSCGQGKQPRILNQRSANAARNKVFMPFTIHNLYSHNSSTSLLKFKTTVTGPGKGSFLAPERTQCALSPPPPPHATPLFTACADRMMLLSAAVLKICFRSMLGHSSSSQHSSKGPAWADWCQLVRVAHKHSGGGTDTAAAAAAAAAAGTRRRTQVSATE
jgi:hypothetical protein